MLSAYVLLYQYFDNEEIKLVNQINQLQSRCLYRDPRRIDEDEAEELYRAKIKLNFVRKISNELLKLFYDL